MAFLQPSPSNNSVLASRPIAGPSTDASNPSTPLPNRNSLVVPDKGAPGRGGNWNEQDSLLLIQAIHYVQDNVIGYHYRYFTDCSWRKPSG